MEAVKNELVVFAASSLTDAFQALATQFEAQHPDTRVILNFASTQQLAIQLAQGAEADVFASADLKHMLDIEQAGRVEQGEEKDFAHNWLVVLIPKSNPGSITEFADLTKPGLKFILVDKAVPAGAYTLEILDKASQNPAYGNEFKNSMINNIVSYEANVRALVSKIIMGEADAGIAYSSDAVGSAADQVKVIEIPSDINVLAKYYIAKVKDSTRSDQASEFIDFVLSKDGQAILKEYGFIPVK
jgi:molybdate transport system substrate-binding protein